MILRIWFPVIVLAALSVGALTWPKHAEDCSAETIAEIGQLSKALERYRKLHGEHPPDFTDQDLVVAHVHRIMPDYHGPIPFGMSAPQALVFWLSGFNDNADEPFFGSGERVPLFDFDAARLDVQDDRAVYLPPGTKAGGAPYFYLDSRTYLETASKGYIGPAPVPYAAVIGPRGAPERWINEGSFQIIAAGADGRFGEPASYKVYPSGNGWVDYDLDNLTNFCDAPLGVRGGFVHSTARPAASHRSQ